MAPKGERYGSLADVLAYTTRLLPGKPREAADQAEEILNAAPGHPEALVLLASAKRLMGDRKGALSIVQELCGERADYGRAYLELGVGLLECDDAIGAVNALERAQRLEPYEPAILGALSKALAQSGRRQEAEEAQRRLEEIIKTQENLITAANALRLGDFANAERAARVHLGANPEDPHALRILAEIAVRIGRLPDGEKLLHQSLARATDFIAARHSLAVLLHRSGRSQEALEQVARMLAADPDNIALQNFRATIQASIGEYEGVITTYAVMLRDHPEQPRGWLSYGHALKTVGRIPECIEAYRKAIALKPKLGEAYWSLANLKTFRFDPSEVDAMRAALAADDITDMDKTHIYYSLGKALEDAKDYAASFAAYEQGAKARRALIRYDANETTDQVNKAKLVFTPEFFARNKSAGAQHPDPIFIVGLPRAGSTLIEQILASHSLVEGTMELPDLGAIAQMIGGRRRASDVSRYPMALRDMSQRDLERLGAMYVERTRVQRKTDAPFFIDKMPNNFLHTGLILSILPSAKIIDARRHPMQNCFSAYKQHFARGHNFSYDLQEAGRYYTDYVALMAHFDAVAPGRVHRVIYEQMVANTEHEIRRLLDYCGLAFEEACVSFYANDRAVRTPSAEQVRQPIFKSGLDQWRNYEPWLGPLRDALGPVLDAYPEAAR